MKTQSRRVCILSKYESQLDSTHHCSELCSTGEAREENQSVVLS